MANEQPRYWVVFAIALVAAVGLMSVHIGNVGSRRGWAYSTASVFFWAGLVSIFVPTAARVLMKKVSSQERLMLLVLLAVALYVVKVLASPHAFTFSDEYTHLRDTQEILRTGHLFSFNPILPTAPYYPGLAALTAGFVDLTGLSPFLSGLAIIGVARVLLVVCLFAVARRLTGSDRGAALAVLVYLSNPSFLFFSATFSYENFALPLCVFLVWWLSRTRRFPGPAAAGIAAITATAVMITHHVSALALASLLTAWWLAERRASPGDIARRNVGTVAGFTIAAALLWFFVVARPASAYLFSHNLWPALEQTLAVVTNQAPPRKLYSSYGLAPPMWESVAGYASTALLLLLLPVALARAWRARSRAPIVVVAAIAALYPLSLVPRLAPGGVALSARSSEYLFVGLGCVIGLLLVTTGASRRTPLRSQSETRAGLRGQLTATVDRHTTVAAVVLVSLVFVGEVIVGTPFYQRMSETARPTGYPWTVQPDVLAASGWAKTNLGIHQRFGASAIDSYALATDGSQDPADGDEIWPVFFGPHLDADVVRTIRSTGVEYLLLDWRMTQGVPPSPGHYFSPFEPGAAEYKSALPEAGLSKFLSSPCADVLYATESIQIVDVSRIEDGTCTP